MIEPGPMCRTDERGARRCTRRRTEQLDGISRPGGRHGEDQVGGDIGDVVSPGSPTSDAEERTGALGASGAKVTVRLLLSALLLPARSVRNTW